MADPVASLNAALEGRYTIDRELGEGGMATVYLADDLKHHRKVALKVLKPELAAVVGAERFLAEIETTANLQHPHILPLFDSGEADNFLYYVMPYIDGESLADRLARERQLPVDEAVRIAIDLAEALDYAHRQKVIHRDIKPANIMMNEGRPLIADFGIALAVGAAGGARLTETGLSVGTPFYMSPEQATGDTIVGPQSDTYALGCVLYEMLVGEPPYSGATAQAVLGKIIAGGPVSATAHRPMIPHNVDGAIRRSLEKLPADRFHTAKELAEALRDTAFRYGDPALAAAPVGLGGTGWSTTVGWGLAVVFGVGLAWSLFRPTAPEPVTRVSVLIPEEQEFHPVRGDLDLSEDGSMMVYRRAIPDVGSQLWLRRWDALDAAPIPDADGVAVPATSPDGREVAFSAGASDIRVVPLQGGVSRTLTEEAFCCPAWSPDGAWVYFTNRANGISRVSSSGGPVEVITELDERNEGGLHWSVDVLPGGDAAVFHNVTSNGSRIATVDLATGEVGDLTPGRWPRYSPTGHLLFVDEGRGTLLAAPFDPASLELTGPALPIADGLMLGANGVEFYDISETGRLIYRTGNTTGLVEPVWVDRDGNAREIDPGWAVPGTEDEASLALSPDGRRLAISTTGPEETVDIYIKQLDDGPLSRLTFEGTLNRRAAWMPDGETIVFTSDRAGQEDVWTKRADGSSAAELLVDREKQISEVVVSRDGEWLLFVEGVGGNSNDSDIYGLKLDGSSEPVPILATEFGETEISLSPDGRWLAYVSNISGDWEVWVRPFPNVDAGRWQISTLRGDEPVWSNDGSELFYRTGFPGERVVAHVTGDPSFAVLSQESLFSLAEYLGPNGHEQYSLSPDNQRFVMLRLKDTDSELVMVENWFVELRERTRN